MNVKLLRLAGREADGSRVWRAHGQTVKLLSSLGADRHAAYTGWGLTLRWIAHGRAIMLRVKGNRGWARGVAKEMIYGV